MEKRLKDHRDIIITVVLVVFLFSFLPVSMCAGDEMLLNGTGIFLTTGETWNFDQGYQLKLKSVNPTSDRVWVVLSLNGEILHEGILGEGETLTYSHNREILNITLDTIYSSPTGELITFTPVYQYLDPELPEPETQDNTEGEQPDDNESDIQEDETNQSIPGFRTLLTLSTVTTLTYFIGKKSKNKK
ncbi:MAG: hypothetical protein SCH66_04275 [Methanolobus sp.]|nr:hypothetical protein [Methanolobus sp.]